MTTPLLELTDVTKQYQAPEGGEPPRVLDGVSLIVEEGQSLAIVGPSGSGKSTLLNIIGTLDRPTSGTVLLDGEDLATRRPDELASLRNRKIGFVFQSHHLLPQCTALENVLVPTLVDGSRNGAAQRARELLERVGLADRMTHRPAQLSGGECQRVALVRGLINRPRLLLADEPTGSLDAAASDGLADLLADLNREQGLTVITVTHARTLAERMGRIMELRAGTLHAEERS